MSKPNTLQKQQRTVTVHWDVAACIRWGFAIPLIAALHLFAGHPLPLAWLEVMARGITQLIG